jgi:hypothetical protein
VFDSTFIEFFLFNINLNLTISLIVATSFELMAS